MVSLKTQTYVRGYKDLKSEVLEQLCLQLLHDNMYQINKATNISETETSIESTNTVNLKAKSGNVNVT